MSAPITRRGFLQSGSVLLGSVVLAACGGAASVSTSSAPAASSAAAAASAPASKPAVSSAASTAASAKPAASSAAASASTKPAASGSTSAGGYVPDKTVKVGMVIPQSGVYASAGNSAVQGIKLALKEFQDKGWKFDVIQEDEKADPTTALKAAQKLIERDQVNFLLGPTSSGDLPALRDPVDQAKIVLSTVQAGTGDITGAKCSRYIFRSTPTNYMQGLGFGDWIAKNLGKKGYVLTADYAAGTEIADAIVDSFKKAGGEVVQYAKAPLTTTDFAPFMSPILSAKPDFVTGFFAGKNAIDAVKAFKQFGVKDKTKIAYSGYLATNDLLDAEGVDTVEGMYGYLDFSESINTPAFQSWTKGMQAMFPDLKVTNVYNLHGYTAAKAVLLGIQGAGSLDSEKIVSAMEKVSFEGPAGPIKFNNSHQSPLTFYVTQVKGGKHDVLATVPNVEDPNKSDCKLT